MPSAPAIGFEYRPSRLVRATHAAVVALALLALAVNAAPWWGRGIAALAVIVLSVRASRAIARPPVAGALWVADGTWTLAVARGGEVPASLVGFRILGSCLWLRLRAAGCGSVTLLLLPDNCAADTRRRLRMRLATMGRALPVA